MPICQFLKPSWKIYRPSFTITGNRPTLIKIALLFPSTQIELVLGIPFRRATVRSD